MNRAWITGLTLASVAGTGGAAFAGMSATTGNGNTASAAPQSGVAEITTTSIDGVTTYQAGPAGSVNLRNEEGMLSVDSALPAPGWSVVSYSGPATHVEVKLTDAVNIVTFVADLVDGKVVASLSAVPVPTAAPAAPAPAPAAPAPALAPSAQAPSPAHTSAPSGSGDDEHEDDDEGEDDHEDEHEDEDEDEGDDD